MKLKELIELVGKKNIDKVITLQYYGKQNQQFELLDITEDKIIITYSEA